MGVMGPDRKLASVGAGDHQCVGVLASLVLCVLMVVTGCTSRPPAKAPTAPTTTPSASAETGPTVRRIERHGVTFEVPGTYSEPTPGQFPIELSGPRPQGTPARIYVNAVRQAGRPLLIQIAKGYFRAANEREGY